MKKQIQKASLYAFNGVALAWYAEHLCQSIRIASVASRLVEQPGSPQITAYCQEWGITPDQVSVHTEDMLESYVYKLADELRISPDTANNFVIENVI